MTWVMRANAFVTVNRGYLLLRVGGRVFTIRDTRRALPVPAMVLGLPAPSLRIGRFQFATYGGLS